MKFVKMHGLGNDFVFFEDKQGVNTDFSELAVKMCDRHTGIGADGIIVIVPSEKADVRMRIINADGSEAEMCGNGIRCFAKYVYDNGIITKSEFAVETLAGIMKPKVTVGKDGKVSLVTINMGKPFMERAQIPMAGPAGPVVDEPVEIDGKTYKITSLLMGVPHTMTYVRDVDAVDLHHLGPQFETYKAFPRKTNMNFIQVLDNHTIKVHTWERGAGATLACGTGSCACAVGSYLNGFTGRSVDVQLYLGTLHIEYDEKDGNVYMTGPAAVTFTGEWLAD
ncbi:diaminopimelate epimerase [Megasphaera cerevisiae DSM 20462]|jgi:diaminopimelate epimerase|uniref:Diaminopimelate epimerase n=1 Tax=Megasphaera cerevisiae DSM 20462 TaxID=1122219 RepID=A0A0J6WQ81_9FIRM|nr:diaminopimelate epimerase [Megasphaera cerevisiae]KMO85550.1 diaminopimelate epimerase [Megasphaera cerevisiae DSM 20462]SKA17375.1 diaminopimelate epimerase [Megasphaera cerevisiae DSM 20462]